MYTAPRPASRGVANLFTAYLLHNGSAGVVALRFEFVHQAWACIQGTSFLHQREHSQACGQVPLSALCSLPQALCGATQCERVHTPSAHLQCSTVGGNLVCWDGAVEGAVLRLQVVAEPLKVEAFIQHHCQGIYKELEGHAILHRVRVRGYHQYAPILQQLDGYL